MLIVWKCAHLTALELWKLLQDGVDGAHLLSRAVDLEAQELYHVLADASVARVWKHVQFNFVLTPVMLYHGGEAASGGRFQRTPVKVEERCRGEQKALMASEVSPEEALCLSVKGS